LCGMAGAVWQAWFLHQKKREPLKIYPGWLVAN
jgi:hypothetical protein